MCAMEWKLLELAVCFYLMDRFELFFSVFFVRKLFVVRGIEHLEQFDHKPLVKLTIDRRYRHILKGVKNEQILYFILYKKGF